MIANRQFLRWHFELYSSREGGQPSLGSRSIPWRCHFLGHQAVNASWEETESTTCLGRQDIEQLLNAHGLHSTGVNQLLQNLYKLLAAAASAAPSSSSGRAPSM